LNQPGRYAAFFFNRIHNIWVYLITDRSKPAFEALYDRTAERLLVSLTRRTEVAR
jgi:hypothetical protein